MKKVLVFCAVVFFALGCTKSGLEIPSNSLLKVSCSFENYDSFDKSENPEGLDSRITDDAFDVGDKIGIYIHTQAEVQNPPTDNHRYNMCYTFNGDITWQGSRPLGDDLTADSYNATGYYPHRDEVANPHLVAHSVEHDQSATGAMSRSDFARAVSTLDNSTPTAPTLNFSGTADNGYAASFKHLMSKLRIEAAIPTEVDGVGVESVASVVIGGLKSDCTVNLATGVVTLSPTTPGAKVVDITPQFVSSIPAASTEGVVPAGSVGVWEAIVVPQSVVEGTDLVTITLNMEGEGNLTKELKYTIGAGEAFTSLESGRRVILTLGNSADLAFVDVLQLAIVDGLDKTGGKFTLKAPSDVAWTVTSSETWLTLANSNTATATTTTTATGIGTGKPQEVTFALALNSSTKIRTATLTLSATINDRAESTTITVTQNYCVLNVASSMSIAADASVSPMLPFTSNQVWTATITATEGGAAPSWLLGLSKSETPPASQVLTCTHIGSVAENTLYYHTTANGGVARSAKIVFRNSSAEKLAEQLVTQAPTGSVKIGKLYWATGNLVAKGVGVGGKPSNECQVGASTDGGLYFQFGSLIGWQGGGSGDGTGSTDPNLGTTIKVRPSGYTADPEWDVCPKYDGMGSIPSPQDEANPGIGDPCAFYLGDPWRLPTSAEFGTLFDVTKGDNWANVPNWEGSGTSAGWSDGPYARYTDDKLLFPAAGGRDYSSGSFYNVSTYGYGWSSSVNSATHGYALAFSSSVVNPQEVNHRSRGLPVRCVSSAPAPPPPPPPTPEVEGVLINRLYWAKGNLVADATGYYCKIGKPADGGLYFQFGSLIGWKGGLKGDGTGIPSPGINPTTPGINIEVKPSGYTGVTGWKVCPKYTAGEAGHIIPASGTASTGIGDPCAFYLGGKWRLPTSGEYKTLFDEVANETAWDKVPNWKGSGTSTGWSNGPYARYTGNKLLFPASGYRDGSSGSFYDVSTNGYGWSSSVNSATRGYYLNFNSSNVYPQDGTNRSLGFPVRCVSTGTVPPPPPPPTPSVDGVEIGGLYWAKGNLVSNDDGYWCKIGASADNGLYFQFGGLIGWQGGANNNGTGAPSTSPAMTVSVRPSVMSSTPTVWNSNYNVQGNKIKGVGVFNYSTGKWGPTSVPWDGSVDIRGFSENVTVEGVSGVTNISGAGDLSTGKYAKIGVGDPCTYYLKGKWRLPTTVEIADMTGRSGSAGQNAWIKWDAGIDGKWDDKDLNGGWFGPGLRNNAGTPSPTKNIFFPVSGYRPWDTGSFFGVGVYGYYWSSSVYNADFGLSLLLHQSHGVVPQNHHNRSLGFPVRCVSDK